MPGKKRLAPGFGERLRELRIARGFTQGDLAKRIGTSKRLISNYETGTAQPTVSVLIDLVRVLKVSSDDLLGLKKFSSLPEMSRSTKRMWGKLQAIQSLPQGEQDSLFKIIDGLLRGSGNGKE